MRSLIARSPVARSLAAIACLAFAACTTAIAQLPATGAPSLPSNNNPIQMNRDGPATRGPVRNVSPVPGQEVTTIRYWKIEKGTFPQFLKASQDGIWPYFEKIGARIVGMWVVIPPPGGKEASPDCGEVYLTTRYASLDHWAATPRCRSDGWRWSRLCRAAGRARRAPVSDHRDERVVHAGRRRPAAAGLHARDWRDIRAGSRDRPTNSFPASSPRA